MSLITKNITISVNKCLVVGPIKQAFDYELPGGSEILIANFKNDTFYRFFGNIMLNKQLPFNPDEFLSENCFSDLWHVLKPMKDQQERVDYMLNFCKPYLQNRDKTTNLLVNFKDKSSDPVKSIAKEIGQSERNIQLQHKKIFGYSAKEINRYQRFLKAAELIQKMALSSTKPDWFEIIDYCNYYDQSQLIHDFKHFINLSPKQFLKFQQDICLVKSE